jgi:hypothetical protein
LPNTGDSHHIELRFGGILLIPFNFTARAEKKQGSQTLALKIKPNLLLYKSGRQTRHPLRHRRAQGPRGGEAAGSSARRKIASLVALSLKRRRERKSLPAKSWLT